MTPKAILCVDDEEMILNSLEMQLNDHFGDDFIYEFAQGGNDALEIVDELVEEGLKILVIVSDWLMPGMKGDELLINIHKKHPSIVKVMLTGQADEEAIERAKNEANLHQCISKPWDVQELVKVINSGIAKFE